YYTANGDVQATPGRPVEPRIVMLLNNTGGNIHGVLLTGATFTDSPDSFNPVINRPTTEWELNPTEPQTALPSFWPYQPGTVNSLTLSNSVIQSLVVTPGQFKATSAPGTTVTGIQRLYSKLSLELLRSTSGDWQPPVIGSVDFRAVNDTTVTVTVTASDPSGISRIVVLRLSNGTFTPTSLLTTGTGPFTLNVSPFSNGDTILVQVVDGAGNIASATGKGASFHVIKVDASVTQVHSPGKPVIFRGVISGFDALPKPVQYTLDFGDGTFADGEVKSATFDVTHAYSGTAKSVVAAMKVTDIGGGVGNDQVLLMFDPAGDVAAGVSANADLTGGAAWIDSTNMTIVLGVKGLVSPDFNYRVRIALNGNGAQTRLLQWNNGKATGPLNATGSASVNQVTFTFKLAELGVKSGDTIQLAAETQGGVPGVKGVGIADNMPDTGWTSYTLY
ncbi:MAG: hypothetical protein Q7R34_08215, partial [Dehalococcoidia bacterium]|nr:hypothetical protein [Dehalococcoidia bacterium]